MVGGTEAGAARKKTYDGSGPVGETGAGLGRDRGLALAKADLLAVRTAAAYGFVMAPTSSPRRRAAGRRVAGGWLHGVRARETFDDLLNGVTVLPWASR